MILVNFKTYKESTGDKAVDLAKSLKEVGGLSGIEVVACPQLVDMRSVLTVLPDGSWAQHVDPEELGRATGWVPPEVIAGMGVKGIVLNHSEHKLAREQLVKTMEMVKSLNLQSLIFADSVDEAKEVAFLAPDWIGYEPPELVASKDTSVARAKPDVIAEVVNAVPNIPILVGAGIKDKTDVAVSIRQGARGIGVASGVILSEDPKKVLFDLAEGFKK